MSQFFYSYCSIINNFKGNILNFHRFSVSCQHFKLLSTITIEKKLVEVKLTVVFIYKN